MKYIIYAPSFSEKNGGSIFLHELVNALNGLGEDAYLWPTLNTHKLTWRRRVRDFFRKKSIYAVNPKLNTPIASKFDINDETIVVYPEITLGNPLNIKNVVRWLLYTPGALRPYEFGKDDFFFTVGEMCDIPEITGGAPDLFMWKINKTYKNLNLPDRKEICFITRKGSGKEKIAETEGAIQIDGMSHREINEIFNKCSTFYSYDEATMYSQYAAISGCLSVVIPGAYLNREEWSKNHILAKYGVAYGLDDLDHARQTQHKVAGLLEAEEQKGLETVERFVELTRARFGG
jgi:hypothetical protein